MRLGHRKQQFSWRICSRKRSARWSMEWNLGGLRSESTRSGISSPKGIDGLHPVPHDTKNRVTLLGDHTISKEEMLGSVEIRGQTGRVL